MSGSDRRLSIAASSPGTYTVKVEAPGIKKTQRTGVVLDVNQVLNLGNALAPGAVAYFNKSAFADPAPYTFGNLPRSAPFGLFVPHLLDESFS